jgi:hypothetical protein
MEADFFDWARVALSFVCVFLAIRMLRRHNRCFEAERTALVARIRARTAAKAAVVALNPSKRPQPEEIARRSDATEPVTWEQLPARIHPPHRSGTIFLTTPGFEAGPRLSQAYERAREKSLICPKCNSESGDAWSQCEGLCPMPTSPEFDHKTHYEYWNDDAR